MDDQLNFNEQVPHLYTEVIQKLAIQNNARQLINHSFARLPYKSLILRLDNCDMIYNNTSQTNLQKLQTVKSACRIRVLTYSTTITDYMHNQLSNLTREQKCKLYLQIGGHKQIEKL